MDLCEFEASLVYRVNSKPARTTQWNSVSKNKQKRFILCMWVFCLHVCVCTMCMCVHTCCLRRPEEDARLLGTVHVLETKPRVSARAENSLQLSLVFWNRVSPVKPSWLATPRDLLSPQFQPGDYKHIPALLAFCRVLVTELGFLCLHDKHFMYWATSLALDWHLD